MNTDPLNIYIGNPDLKQSFRHQFNVNYSKFNLLKETNIWFGVNYSLTQNAFSQFSRIDSGIRTYQTVNVDGIQFVNLHSSYGRKIKSLDMRINFSPTFSYSRNKDFVRDEKTFQSVQNVTTTNSVGMDINMGKFKEGKYNFNFGPRFSWNNSEASVNTASNASYWQLTGWGQGEVNITKKMVLGTDVNFQTRQRDPRFPADNNFTTWNANLTQRFMKDNALEAKIAIFDILNQNRGYNRNFNSFSFTETYYNTLRRFWMVSLVWNISKNGKPANF